MTKDRIIEILEDLQSYINREAVDVMNVNIKQVHAEALKQGIFELKKETVSRENYEWEYRIRRDLDNENAVLKEQCKALEKKVEELKNGTTEKILIELPEDLYKSIMAHRSKTKFQENLDYQTLKNVIECGRKIPDCEVQGMTRLEENRIVNDEMAKRAKSNPTGTYEEMVTFQLGAIATMLADISKSLAVIAEKAESEVERNDVR